MSMRLAPMVKAYPAVTPQSAGAGAVTTIPLNFSGLGYWDDAVLMINLGAATGSPSAFAGVSAKIQDSADGVTYADLKDPSGNVYQLAAPVSGAGIYKLPFDREKARQYVQAVVTVGAFTGGTSPAVPISASYLLGNPKVAPQ